MTEPRAKVHQLLPAHQLAAAIDRMIARADTPRIVFAGNVHNNIYSSGPNIRAGLDINDRTHFGWRDGDKPTVGIDVADRVLLKAGLCWWDVWNEDTVRQPALTVTTYAFRSKQCRGGRRRGRTLKAITRYGDLGTDWDTLRRIQDLWEPAAEPAIEMAA